MIKKRCFNSYAFSRMHLYISFNFLFHLKEFGKQRF